MLGSSHVSKTPVSPWFDGAPLCAEVCSSCVVLWTSTWSPRAPRSAVPAATAGRRRWRAHALTGFRRTCGWRRRGGGGGGMEPIRGSWVPQHHPMRVGFAVVGAKRQVLRAVRPQSVPMPEPSRHPQALLLFFISENVETHSGGWGGADWPRCG